jgi:hypothetical protein
MKPHLPARTLILVTVLLTSSCASATEASTAVPGMETPSSTAVATVSPSVPRATTEAAAEPTQGIQPLATSRGPELHATDPSTVNLAAGQLQVVEFFRFT